MRFVRQKDKFRNQTQKKKFKIKGQALGDDETMKKWSSCVCAMLLKFFRE
jgi:hypothetical protein